MLAGYFVDRLSICLVFSYDCVNIMHFWQECLGSANVPFSVHDTEGYNPSTRPVTGDLNFCRAVEVVSAKGLLYMFPFVIERYLVGRYFEAVQISASPVSILFPSFLPCLSIRILH